ncbi:putative metallo-beta-lactamase domain protein, partial [Aureobasidium melanogenum]
MRGAPTSGKAAEIETPQILHAWQKSLDLIASLNATKIIPGHLEKGREMDGQADLAHTRKYLQLFDDLIQNASQKHKVDELYQRFKEAFPEADKNLDFFLGQLSNAFGQGGQKWEENRHHNFDQRAKEQLEGFII